MDLEIRTTEGDAYSFWMIRIPLMILLAPVIALSAIAGLLFPWLDEQRQQQQ
ncbi:MAG TPA: hypothetical protein PLO37_12505 [Candidatus Hydrogenedentes bacterium]|nr:hypothetical protein [Candidatus Hydrogenedentota bacterium]HPG67663.1 hypothetical protein [Candidatus Hydrogenedentota bacterium]